MRINVIKRFVLAASLFGLASLAYAVSLSNAIIKSYSNEPLHIEADIMGDGEITLAPATDYLQYNYEPLNYEVTLEVREEEGVEKLFITTENPIDDPSLTLLLRTKSEEGRLGLLELPIILDFRPQESDEKESSDAKLEMAEEVATSKAEGEEKSSEEQRSDVVKERKEQEERERAQEKSEEKREEEVARKPEAAPIKKAAAPTASVKYETARRYGPVKAGETMWSIANAVKPAHISTQRMIDEIKRHNPRSFTRQGVLLENTTLNIPDLDRPLGGEPEGSNDAITTEEVGRPIEVINIDLSRYEPLREDGPVGVIKALPSLTEELPIGESKPTVTEVEEVAGEEEESIEAEVVVAQPLEKPIVEQDQPQIEAASEAEIIDEQESTTTSAEVTVTEEEATSVEASVTSEPLTVINEPSEVDKALKEDRLRQLEAEFNQELAKPGILEEYLVPIAAALVALVLALVGFLLYRRRSTERALEEEIAAVNEELEEEQESSIEMEDLNLEELDLEDIDSVLEELDEVNLSEEVSAADIDTETMEELESLASITEEEADRLAKDLAALEASESIVEDEDLPLALDLDIEEVEITPQEDVKREAVIEPDMDDEGLDFSLTFEKSEEEAKEDDSQEQEELTLSLDRSEGRNRPLIDPKEVKIEQDFDSYDLADLEISSGALLEEGEKASEEPTVSIGQETVLTEEVDDLGDTLEIDLSQFEIDEQPLEITRVAESSAPSESIAEEELSDEPVIEFSLDDETPDIESDGMNLVEENENLQEELLLEPLTEPLTIDSLEITPLADEPEPLEPIELVELPDDDLLEFSTEASSELPLETDSGESLIPNFTSEVTLEDASALEKALAGEAPKAEVPKVEESTPLAATAVEEESTPITIEEESLTLDPAESVRAQEVTDGNHSTDEDEYKSERVKLELAEAYIGFDARLARPLLEEVLEDGNEELKEKAATLLKRLESVD